MPIGTWILWRQGTNLRKLLGWTDLSDHFRKIIICYKRIGYNMNVIRQTACLVVNPTMVNNFADLFLIWCLGQDMEFDCNDSWSLPFYLLWYILLLCWHYVTALLSQFLQKLKLAKWYLFNLIRSITVNFGIFHDSSCSRCPKRFIDMWHLIGLGTKHNICQDM